MRPISAFTRVFDALWGTKAGGGGRTRTYEGVSKRIYSPPPLPLGTLPRRRTRLVRRRIYSRWQAGFMGSVRRGVNRTSSTPTEDRKLRADRQKSQERWPSRPPH